MIYHKTNPQFTIEIQSCWQQDLNMRTFAKQIENAINTKAQGDTKLFTVYKSR